MLEVKKKKLSRRKSNSNITLITKLSLIWDDNIYGGILPKLFCLVLFIAQKLKMINSNSNNLLYEECEKDGLEFIDNGFA